MILSERMTSILKEISGREGVTYAAALSIALIVAKRHWDDTDTKDFGTWGKEQVFSCTLEVDDCL